MGLRLPKQLPQLSGWVLTLYRYGLPILFMVGLFSVFYASPAATNRNTQFHTWPLADWRLSDFTAQDWTSAELINEGRQSNQMRFVPSLAYKMG